jgi:hypothetical protein
MAAGLGYIEFNTGDILTAASANGYLASQTVMVFADAAARTLAITSPQEGMISYLKSTDAVEKYNGSAWVAIVTASSGALTKITSQSFTASSSVNVNDVFSSTYKNYKVLLNLTSSTAGVNCFYRLRVAGADNSTANYATEVLNATGTTVTGARSVGQTSGEIVDIKNVNANQEITFFNPFASQLTYIYSEGNWEASSPIVQIRASGFNATTSFTGFSINPASGTITGSLIVYGLAD